MPGRGAVELVRDGFHFLEGPVWSTSQNALLFTDFPEDRIYRLDATTGRVEEHRAPSGKANGLAIDGAGRLWACEHHNRRVSRADPDGAVETLVDRFRGARFNSPNDIVVRSDGNAYFSDPEYGLAGRPRELDGNHVFRIAPGGTLEIACRGGPDSRPNGIQLSPDERTLYVADTRSGEVRAFVLDADGAVVGSDRLFATTAGEPDGMAVDSAGNLYVTSAAGVEVFAADGRHQGVIPIPLQPSNCAFGGDDARSLYVTAHSGLYRVRLAATGRR